MSLLNIIRDLYCALIRQSSERHSKDPRQFTPQLETLEDRTVPAVYTWKAGAAGNWSTPANWQGTAAGVPDDVNDVAVFDGGVSNADVTLLQANRTIGKLEVKNGYTGTINLSRDLTIKGRGQGASTISSPLKLAPLNIISDLILDDAKLTVQAGTLGSTAFVTQLRVENTAVLNFELDSTVTIGMDLIIGTAQGGNGKGEVNIKDYNGPRKLDHLLK